MRKLALLLVAAPLALAACGRSSGPQVKVDPAAYVKHAAITTAGVKSEHMTMTGTISGGMESTALHGSGDFANSPIRGLFQISAAGTALGSESSAMSEVLAGGTVYIRPPFTGHLPRGKTWAAFDVAQFSKANHLSFLSQSPTQLLGALEAAGSVKSLGTETIDGVATTHLHVTKVDISKIPERTELEGLADATVGPIDVWIGNSDGYVHRESVSISASSDGQSGSFEFTVDFSKFNEPVSVTVPPASETVNLAKSLGGLG